jgi:D-beta-D-heptose 7-phosphate kinase/D-beta-D-heptose 1-phosphate adenosyltransferase
MTRDEAQMIMATMRTVRGGRMGTDITLLALQATLKDMEKHRPLALTNGVFGGAGLTAGQAWCLAQAHEGGHVPIVLLASDKVAAELKAYECRPFEERMIVVAAALTCGFVIEWEALRVTDAIRELRPNRWVKGGDYTLETLDQEERAAAEEAGAKIVLVPELPTLHVSELTGGAQ